MKKVAFRIMSQVVRISPVRVFRSQESEGRSRRSESVLKSQSSALWRRGRLDGFFADGRVRFRGSFFGGGPNSWYTNGRILLQNSESRARWQGTSLAMSVTGLPARMPWIIRHSSQGGWCVPSNTVPIHGLNS
jgi:hypothetical protein